MRFKRIDINSSPYIGVYATVGNKIGIFPKVLKKKDEEIVKNILDIEIIKINLGDSTINGAISKIYDNKIILSRACLKKNKKELEDLGLKTMFLDDYLAVGNLVAINKNGLLLSTEFNKRQATKIEKFFEKKAHVFNIANISVVGSCLALNDKHVAAFPHVDAEEFEKIKKIFKVDGNIATVNYGEGLVANGVLLNNKGILMGSKTTGHELIRIDSIFGE
jgi:translation initiation factor 6